MVLSILGKPHLLAFDKPQAGHVMVSYNPDLEITTVDCDVDIVTLGLAVNILNQQYANYLDNLDPHIAKQIHDITMKAVHDLG